MSATLVIIALTCLVSFQAFNDPHLMGKLKHFPYAENRVREYYRFITSGFVHNDWMHLAINMFVFWQFGTIIENTFQAVFGESLGIFLFVLLYISAIVVSDIPSFFKHRENPYYGAVGASGGVSAITFAFTLFYPWQEICLYGLLCLPSLIMGVLYLVYEQWASRKADDNIGHDAHFAGAIWGVVFTFALAALMSPATVDFIVNQFTEGFPY
jgi:membrane associated rhomboid family serine protease